MKVLFPLRRKELFHFTGVEMKLKGRRVSRVAGRSREPSGTGANRRVPRFFFVSFVPFVVDWGRVMGDKAPPPDENLDAIVNEVVAEGQLRPDEVGAAERAYLKEHALKKPLRVRDIWAL